MASKKKAVVEEIPMLGRPSNNVKIGIVGLPNVGKSSFFNLLCKMSVPAENFPFCTIEPTESRVVRASPVARRPFHTGWVTFCCSHACMHAGLLRQAAALTSEDLGWLGRRALTSPLPADPPPNVLSALARMCCCE
jgi:hypothetical protein